MYALVWIVAQYARRDRVIIITQLLFSIVL